MPSKSKGCLHEPWEVSSLYSSSVGLDLADGSLFRLLRSCVILMAHRGVGVINKCIHLEDFFSTYRSKLLHSNLVFGSVPCQRCTFFFVREVPCVLEGVCFFVCS